MWACRDELRPVAPTPDVVGLGLLVAFAGSAGLAIVALLLQYLFFYRPQADVRRALDPDQPWAVAQRPNPIDALLLWRFRGALRRLGIRCGDMRTPERESGFRPVLERSILSVADVQLGMGLALLIYGYTSLASGISAYSWWNMVGLVWFAVITNLAAQSYLRKYYLEHPGQRQWRLWLLITMIAALVVSMVPTVRMKRSLANDIANPQELLTTRALCYFPLPGRSFDFIEDDRDTAYSSGYVLILAALIIVSVALLRQYEKPGSPLHAWRDMYRGDMQRPLVGDQIDCIRCEHRFLLLAVRPYMSFWLVLRLYADLTNSILTEVGDSDAALLLTTRLTPPQIACSMLLLAWVTIRYADIRKIDPGLDTEWSLIQILALVVFAAPLKALADFACGAVMNRPARPRVRFARPALPKFSVFDWMRTSRKAEDKGKDPEVPPEGRRNEPEDDGQREDHDQIEDDASDITQLLVTPATSLPENTLTRTRTQSVGSSALWPDLSVADSLMAPSEAELEGIEEEEQRREYIEEQRENDEALACEDFFLGLQGQFYFQTAWLPIGLQVLVFATVLYMVLLFALPRMVEMSPSHVLAHTGAWYLLYQPLLLFVFLLASMVVEERARPSERARSAYLALGAAAALLSAGAVIDTIFGLGGTPMSYVALSALGLALLTYVLFGFVARPGRLAKGKDRSYMGEGDVEEQRSLLYSPAPTLQSSIQLNVPPGGSPIRPFAVRRPIRYHGPARRPGAPKLQFRSKYGRTYGTML